MEGKKERGRKRGQEGLRDGWKKGRREGEKDRGSKKRRHLNFSLLFIIDEQPGVRKGRQHYH